MSLKDERKKELLYPDDKAILNQYLILDYSVFFQEFDKTLRVLSVMEINKL